jgi:spoIIIJ-associated protein
MRSVETEGATIDEAIDRALELLREGRDRVEIEILSSAARGLLGFGGTKARIRATVRSPLFSTGTGAQPVSRETPLAPVSPERLEAAVTAARRTLEEILRQLGTDDSVDVQGPTDGVWSFQIAGADAGIVIGRHGQTLDAIEYLLNRIGSHASESAFRIEVDVEGYRQRRQEALEQTAKRAALKVRDSGRPVVLNPMSPRDRRIVHIALGEFRDVSTRSEGEGAMRHVVVVPARAEA